MRKESGFTLAELAITLAIIVIVSAIAVPSYLTWLPKYRTKNAVLNMIADLKATKNRAIQSNQSWSVWFSSAKNSYYLLSDWGANGFWDGPPTGGDDTLVKTVDLDNYKAGVHFTLVSGNPLTFTNRGLCPATVEVKLTNQHNTASYRVQTTLSGSVLSEKLN
ncbi:MAG: GspH/FimT family pseudopilin [Desulfobacterales bacterium]|jgi:type IV fimbrial biogenesis protein FimT